MIYFTFKRIVLRSTNARRTRQKALPALKFVHKFWKGAGARGGDGGERAKQLSPRSLTSASAGSAFCRVRRAFVDLGTVLLSFNFVHTMVEDADVLVYYDSVCE